MSRFTVITLSCCSLLLATACGGDQNGTDANSPNIFTVNRGDLVISITEQAELRASQETRVRSEVEGQALVIFLIDEGTRVEAGDRLVELDVSELEDKLANQEITVERARASLVNAQQDMGILEKEIAADRADSQSKVEIAKIDLEKFFGKPRPTDQGSDDVTDTDVTTNRDMLDELTKVIDELNTGYAKLPVKVVAFLSEENLDREMGEMGQAIIEKIDAIAIQAGKEALSEDTVLASRKLFDEEYITAQSLRQDELNFKSDQSRLKLNWNQLDLLISYQQRKEKITLELALSNAELLLEKTIASANAKRARGKAELSSIESEYELTTERLKVLKFQIAHAIIRAPTPGLVVYATQGDGRRGREVVEEGSEVRERQSLILLPDTTTMVAHLKVQEADIDSVVTGQGALIKIDAYQDRAFTGKVTRVSPLPDSGSRWSNNDLKVYKAEITLDPTGVDLRPNMTAEVEIVVGRLSNILYVPIPAVRRQGLVHYVWTKTSEGPKAVKIELGRNNLTSVELLAGNIKVGAHVFLAPPSGVEVPRFEQPERNEPQIAVLSAAEIKQKQAEQKKRRQGGGDPGERRSSSTDRRKLFNDYKQKVIEKLPQYKADIEDGFGWFRNEEIQAAIDADPELKAMKEKMSAGMRGGNRGGERPGGNRGGERGGERGGGNRGRERPSGNHGGSQAGSKSGGDGDRKQSDGGQSRRTERGGQRDGE